MSEAVSLLAMAAEMLGRNQRHALSNWLEGVKAIPLDAYKIRYSQLPWEPSQEAHGFSWSKKHSGWVDILKSEDDVVQIVLHLSYPKRRWFSQHKKDWKKMSKAAQSQFESGKQFTVNERESWLIDHKGLKILMKSYEQGKLGLIELKIAKHQFYA